MTEKLVVWYIDWRHAIMFEVLVTIAATCSLILVLEKLWRWYRRK